MNLSIEFFARFFSLALVNETAALEALEAFCIKAEISIDSNKLVPIDENLINTCFYYLERARKNSEPTEEGLAEDFFKWSFLRGDLKGVWLQFRSRCPKDEFMAVLLHLVMGLSLDQAAAWLGISSGTLRFRSSYGLDILATIIGGGASGKETVQQKNHRL